MIKQGQQAVHAFSDVFGQTIGNKSKPELRDHALRAGAGLREALGDCRRAIEKWDAADESAEGGWADNAKGEAVYDALHAARTKAWWALETTGDVGRSFLEERAAMKPAPRCGCCRGCVPNCGCVCTCHVKVASPAPLSVTPALIRRIPAGPCAACEHAADMHFQDGTLLDGCEVKLDVGKVCPCTGYAPTPATEGVSHG